MHREFDILSTQLADVLNGAIPRTDPAWWQRFVTPSLSQQQVESVQRNRATDLEDLDLPSLLSVADGNWAQLQARFKLPYETRMRIRLARRIRNRWAHAPASGIDPDQRHRDFDLLMQLLRDLGVPVAVVAQLRGEYDKASPRAQEPPAPAAPTTALLLQASAQLRDEPTLLRVGDKVRLVSQPGLVGVVTAVDDASPEARATVFHSIDDTRTYFASQVRRVEVPAGPSMLDVAGLQRALTAIQLRHPSTKTLYSLFSSRINFVPYQFRPVLKLIQADQPRLLIADEVGVGKTIEAGLIIKELEARGALESALVICPKPLITQRKWQRELERFDQSFEHVDSAALRYCVRETDEDAQWPAKYRRAILPYSILDETAVDGNDQKRTRRIGLKELDPPPSFDLVIVDEAHHARNRESWNYRAVEFFTRNAKAVLFLSATPIQLGSEDLFTLLNLLRPDLIASRRDFALMAEPNRSLGSAADRARRGGAGWATEVNALLQEALMTRWGGQVLRSDPRVDALAELLAAPEPSDEDRVRSIRTLDELNTFSGLINRTRRRDIGEHFTTRKPETVEADFTPQQRQVHDRVLEVTRRIYMAKQPGINTAFWLSTLRRQAASSINGLAPFVDDLLQNRLSALDIDELDGTVGDRGSITESFRAELADISELARGLGDEDPKLDRFLELVAQKQALPNRKMLVFSSFRHTLGYLLRHLQEVDIRVGLITGSTDEDERRELMERFSVTDGEDAIDVLLSSEVGTEGLDYQFCDTLVNYDLPWNPMRVEQRIGRLDRYGQASPTVAIYNLVTADTVDAEIYHRCLLRIGVFRAALGGSEEILGELTKELSRIAESLDLTPEQQAERLQQLADNQVRTVVEQRELEEKSSALMGIDLPPEYHQALDDASSDWLTPTAIASLVAEYLADRDISLSHDLATATSATMRLSAEHREALLRDLDTTLGAGGDPIVGKWRSLLRSSQQWVRLTVDTVAADADRRTQLLSPTHPLTRVAAASSQPVGAIETHLTVASGDVPPGRYPFGLYGWDRLGVRNDFELRPVAPDPAVERHLAVLIEQAWTADDARPLTGEERANVDRANHAVWTRLRQSHIADTKRVLDRRRSSITATQNARLAVVEGQLDVATSERIRRMRRGEIRNIKEALEQALTENDRQAAAVDLITRPLGYGTITVVPE